MKTNTHVIRMVSLSCSLLILVLYGCTKGANDIVSRFSPVISDESIIFSVSDIGQLIVQKISHEKSTAIYSIAKVLNVSKNGNNLLIVVDQGGADIGKTGFLHYLLIGEKGVVRKLGPAHGMCLVHSYVVMNRSSQVKDINWPVVEIYSIFNNNIEYSLSVAEYGLRYLGSDYRETTALYIEPTANENVIKLSFVPEDISLLDLLLNIREKKIEIIK